MPRKLLFIALLLLSSAALSQETDIYANPQNLKVLSDEITPGELRETMKGFAFALDVRCADCHVGEEGQPLSEWDFALDEKPMKASARDMLRMVAAINSEYLTKLDDKRREGLEVSCMTCHRGQDRPRLIQDILDVKMQDGGIAKAIDEYRMLRDHYFGSGTFDFSASPVREYALALAQKGDIKDALQLMTMDIEYYPDNALNYWYLGRIQNADGDVAGAIKSFETTIELSPEQSGFLKPLLEKLKKSLDSSED